MVQNFHVCKMPLKRRSLVSGDTDVVRTNIRVLPKVVEDIKEMLKVPSVQEILQFKICPSQVHTDGTCEILILKLDKKTEDAVVIDYISCLVMSFKGRHVDHGLQCLHKIMDANVWDALYSKTFSDEANETTSLDIDSTVDLSDEDSVCVVSPPISSNKRKLPLNQLALAASNNDSVCVISPPTSSSKRISSLNQVASVTKPQNDSICIIEDSNSTPIKQIRLDVRSPSRCEEDSSKANSSLIVLESPDDLSTSSPDQKLTNNQCLLGSSSSTVNEESKKCSEGEFVVRLVMDKVRHLLDPSKVKAPEVSANTETSHGSSKEVKTPPISTGVTIQEEELEEAADLSPKAGKLDSDKSSPTMDVSVDNRVILGSDQKESTPRLSGISAGENKANEDKKLEKAAGPSSKAGDVDSCELSSAMIILDSEDETLEEEIVIEKELPKNKMPFTVVNIDDDDDDDVLVCKVQNTAPNFVSPVVKQKKKKKKKLNATPGASTSLAADFIPFDEFSAPDMLKHGNYAPLGSGRIYQDAQKKMKQIEKMMQKKKKKDTALTRASNAPGSEEEKEKKQKLNATPGTSTSSAPDYIPLSGNRAPVNYHGNSVAPLGLRKPFKNAEKKFIQHEKVKQKKENKHKARVKASNVPGSEEKKITEPNIVNLNGDVAQKSNLRPVIIDANNVAVGHGRKKFSLNGLKICIKFFQDKGHKVVAFVPKYRRFHISPEDRKSLDELEVEGVVCFTPSRTMQDGRKVASYDDRFIVQAAHELGGVIVSTDNFRDLLDENEDWRETIEQRLLMFTWMGDMLMFPNDPLGRNGPNLHDFLRFPCKDRDRK